MEIGRGNLSEFVPGKDKHANLIIALGNHINVTFSHVAHISNSGAQKIHKRRKDGSTQTTDSTQKLAKMLHSHGATET